ncbi:hypothetical protein BDN72DRAFT_892719 [Pluteus cervinus]|uniref:Uncharacterized protein n=1 Tax=Pluteus cervinus TaxID=181527 RepID=A0ACD3B9N6_9AGAR|nr:hypothetical protein BDN72DRAFT_892719 [Pluteus cervinus]
MTQTPPSLQYLTIYNPTLQPSSESSEEDDEDLEEQAHIVFYTAKERAESRDKMLRRVGLAKALVNFSEMFNSEDLCNSIHSQSRRMVIISPEPNYYIHACVEVAKVLKPPLDKKGKNKETGKDKQKQGDKGKGKESQQPAYDYLDGLVHDVALKAELLKGYEQFKVTHGSFSAILETLGREALELQLERFFTVWAWSWNLDEGANFEDQMGVELHPLFPSIVSLLDTFLSGVDGDPAALVILPPYAVPSTRYLQAGYPPALVNRLTKIIPVPPSESGEGTPPLQEKSQKPEGFVTGEPTVAFPSSISGNLLSTMDVRKWNWPGYLTFGKSHSQASSVDKSSLLDRFDPLSDTVVAPTPTGVAVDRTLLDDAISSHTSESTSTSPQESGIIDLPPPEKTEDDAHYESFPNGDEKRPQKNEPPPDLEEPVPVEAPIFSTTTAHISLDESLPATRQSIYYLISGDPPTMVAFLGLSDDEPNTSGMQSISFSAQTLIKDIHRVIEDDLSKTIVDTDVVPTAANILQASDKHVISASGFKISSPEFTSKSGTLFDAQLIQEIDPEIMEVFSRGQNPQHWHIAKRGAGKPNGGLLKEGNVYLEVFRKETTLPDVDNVLARVVNKSGLSQGNESTSSLSI